MAREFEVSGASFRRVSMSLRVGTIVLAVMLIGVSAATIGIIEDNNYLSNAHNDLQVVTIQSLGAAGSLIVLGFAVLIGESVFIVLAIINYQSLKLVRKILDIAFSLAGALGYCIVGIGCMHFANDWGEPPKGCDAVGDNCDDEALTATNALSGVLSIIQMLVFAFLAVWVRYAIVKRREVYGPQNTLLMGHAVE